MTRSGAAESCADTLTYGVLGPVTAWLDGTEIPMPNGIVRELFATFVTRKGQPIRREALAELLREKRPRLSVNSLYNGVSRLRDTFEDAGTEPPVRTDGSSYSIPLSPGQLDETRFAELADLGRAAADRGDYQSAWTHLSDALELDRGEPLSNIDFPALTDAEVPRLIDNVLTVRADRLKIGLHLGLQREILSEARRLAREHPLHEPVHEQFMHIQYLVSGQSDALATFHKIRAALAAEHGGVPGAGLRLMFERVLNHDLTLNITGGPPVVRPRVTTENASARAGFRGKRGAGRARVTIGRSGK